MSKEKLNTLVLEADTLVNLTMLCSEKLDKGSLYTALQLIQQKLKELNVEIGY